MRHIRLIVLLAFSVVLVGCIQEEVKARGQGKFWDVELTFILAKDYEEESGSLLYKGNEDVSNFSYEITYPPELGRGSSGTRNEIDPGTKYFLLGKSSSNRGSNKEVMQNAIKKMKVEIRWETVGGDSYEEIITIDR
ncbi:hypothetical protein DS745_12050 [Anaerobacillus alkaliphilus]|uniref:Uncharacterized protein n=1 Tax=Anaerobacillus alkaliphilus TaxID=1548597 RepID=A0A4Q0VSR9_9BACI|nr:hypothetical protein [Anaerobacillus alkaliphilus]RXJ00259.1 hypothetical protein DS745_12050 [Anaerobacillus alkaliphilus]